MQLRVIAAGDDRGVGLQLPAAHRISFFGQGPLGQVHGQAGDVLLIGEGRGRMLKAPDIAGPRLITGQAGQKPDKVKAPQKSPGRSFQ